jgi:hypothetical protein
MGFNPSKAENNIWISKKYGLHESMAVYVDNILIAATDPKEITTALESQLHFKLKGVGPHEYHLGCNYFCNNDGTLCFGSWMFTNMNIEQFVSCL